MREYKFRGININGSNFIYGYGVVVCDEINEASIIHKQGHNLTQHTSVAIETVGQYTGLKDKNGVEIYENDLLKDENGDIHLVWIDEGCMLIGDKDKKSDDFLLYGRVHEKEVIGNIYQNKELL